jgi:hypothetical protein
MCTVLFAPVLYQLFDELKTHPNVSYMPGGEGLDQIIPKEIQ